MSESSETRYVFASGKGYETVSVLFLLRPRMKVLQGSLALPKRVQYFFSEPAMFINMESVSDEGISNDTNSISEKPAKT